MDSQDLTNGEKKAIIRFLQRDWERAQIKAYKKLGKEDIQFRDIYNELENKSLFTALHKVTGLKLDNIYGWHLMV